MPKTLCPLNDIEYRAASWVLKIDRGAAFKASTGGVLCGPDAKLVEA